MLCMHMHAVAMTSQSNLQESAPITCSQTNVAWWQEPLPASHQQPVNSLVIDLCKLRTMLGQPEVQYLGTGGRWGGRLPKGMRTLYQKSQNALVN